MPCASTHGSIPKLRRPGPKKGSPPERQPPPCVAFFYVLCLQGAPPCALGYVLPGKTYAHTPAYTTIMEISCTHKVNSLSLLRNLYHHQLIAHIQFWGTVQASS